MSSVVWRKKKLATVIVGLFSLKENAPTKNYLSVEHFLADFTMNSFWFSVSQELVEAKSRQLSFRFYHFNTTLYNVIPWYNDVLRRVEIDILSEGRNRITLCTPNRDLWDIWRYKRLEVLAPDVIKGLLCIRYIFSRRIFL